MKRLKGVLLALYSIITVFAVVTSVIVYKMSSDIEKNGYTGSGSTYYMLCKDGSEDFKVPKNALVRFYRSDSPYKVSDVVVCQNSDGELNIGRVSDYSNDADYIMYQVDFAGKSVSVPKLYVLGRADNYSEFLGAVSAATLTSSSRMFMLVLPSALLVIGLLAIVIAVAVKRGGERAADEKSNASAGALETAAEAVGNVKKTVSRKREPYVNPNSHIELLKYDWLKEVAENAAKSEPELKPDEASDESAENEKSTKSDAESAIADSNAENENKIAKASEKSEDETTEDNLNVKSDGDIVPENVVSFDEMKNMKQTDAYEQSGERGDNASIINEMLKLINKASKNDNENNTDRS